MSNNITNQFLTILYNMKDNPFSEKLRHQVKRCLLDYLGATFSGIAINGEKSLHLLKSLDNSNNGVSIIGMNQKASVLNSAIINGIHSHVSEMDDGVRFGMIHPGAPIFSALLPVAEQEGINFKNFISGVIIAYEAAVRIARAVQPNHYNMGYHPTGTCGSIGAAIGIAVMLDLSIQEMKDILSAVTVASGGMLKVIEDGSELKPFNVARASASAILAAYSGISGFSGLDDVFSGDIGFFSMMSRDGDLSELVKNIENNFEIENTYFKPYASCRHTHPSIEAVLKLKKENVLRYDQIKEVKVHTYKGIIGKHDHKMIQSVASAKMSLPFSVALALYSDNAGIKEFCYENVINRKILQLVDKVFVFSDEELSSLVPNKRAAIIEIRTVDDKVFSERIDYPKGEPENPLSDNELIEKFNLLSIFGNKTENEYKELESSVWNLDNSMEKLFQLL